MKFSELQTDFVYCLVNAAKVTKILSNTCISNAVLFTKADWAICERTYLFPYHLTECPDVKGQQVST